MSERDALFSFMDGLKPWAKQELQRRGVHDLSRAIVAAESLVEFESAKRPTRLKDKSSTRAREDTRVREESSSSEDEYESKPKDCKPRYLTAKKGKWKVGEDRTKIRKSLECFLCVGLHPVKDCPTKAKLATITRIEESDSEKESHKGQKRLGAIELHEPSQSEVEPNCVVRLRAMRILQGGRRKCCKKL